MIVCHLTLLHFINTANSANIFWMNVYIAYKYRYQPNKAQLKSDLQAIADLIDSMGNKAFILGRDVQKWDLHQSSRLSSFFDIITHVGKHDVLFVFFDTKVHTNGLYLECILAKLHGLKVILAKKEGLNASILEKIAHTKIEFKDLADLLSKVETVLK